MGRQLPQRIFYSLPELERLWNVSTAEVKQWLVHGELAASVWLPLMVFHEVREQDGGDHLVLSRSLLHREGYTRLSSHHCRALFAKGQHCLREFPNSAGDGRYVLPDAADCFCINLSELVVLHEDRLCFESEHGMNFISGSSADPTQGTRKNATHAFDPSFKILWHQGQYYSFGDMQAKVVRLLYEAAEEGEPWQNGKRILGKVGSQSYSLSNVFKRHPAWGKNFIQTDKSGSYRLSNLLLSSLRDSKRG